MHIKLSNTWGKNDTVHSSPRRIPLKKLLKKKKTVWVPRQKVNSLTENRKSHWEYQGGSVVFDNLDLALIKKKKATFN